MLIAKILLRNTRSNATNGHLFYAVFHIGLNNACECAVFTALIGDCTPYESKVMNIRLIIIKFE